MPAATFALIVVSTLPEQRGDEQHDPDGDEGRGDRHEDELRGRHGTLLLERDIEEQTYLLSPAIIAGD